MPADVTLTLTAPTPIPVPAGFPPARLVSIDLADGSGRVCGTLAFADVALGFEVGEGDGPPLIESPDDEYGQWVTQPALNGVLPPDISPAAYLEYLREVIAAADDAFRIAASKALTALSQTFLGPTDDTRGPASTPADDEDGDPYPRSSCGCGYDIVFTPEGWQHDAAPWFWGDDHEPDAPEPSEQEQERMHAMLGTDDGEDDL